jgi:putative ABC transport system permease protein
LAIGAASILLFGGYSKNIEYSMQTIYVRAVGHMQIQHRDFFHYGSGNPTAYGIADYERIIETVRKDEALKDSVVVVTPTLQFGGIAGNYKAGASRTVVGFGLMASEQELLRQWNDFDVPIVAQPSPLQGAAADAAIIGTGLARVLHLCKVLKLTACSDPPSEPEATGASLPSDIAQLSESEATSGPATAMAPANRIELLASNVRGTPNVAAVEVIQAEPQAFKEFDEIYVALGLKYAQRLVYGATPPKVTSIIVQLRHSDQIDAAKTRIASILGTAGGGQPLSVLDFRTLTPFYVQSQILFDTIFGFIYCLIGAIVLFTVGNTMNMAVAERTVEIGTLRSLGLRRSGIRRLFVYEGFILGIAGGIAGVVLALVAAAIINELGLSWLPPGSAQDLPLKIRVWGEYPMLVGTTCGLIVVATLSALWPAHRAAKLIIVDALRHA